MSDPVRVKAQSRRRFMVLFSLIAFLCIAFGRSWAQNENETVGFQSTHIFESGNFGENIDILNGGLNLTVPLGPRFQVNTRLGHQVQLFYNSKIWDSSAYRMGTLFQPFEIMPYNEGPTGIGFAMHLGRIVVEQQYMVEPPPSGWYSQYSRTYKWIAPDGSQHEIYHDDRRTGIREDANVAMVVINGGNDAYPSFGNRMTTDGSFILVSGPDNKYCYPSTATGCYQVKTPDGLIYTLAPRVACDDPVLPSPYANGQQYAEWRGELQSFCGFYTTLIEDSTVGHRDPALLTDGPILTPYPNHVKVVYDTRPGFEHVMARIEDSSGRVTTFNSCQYDAATDACKATPDTPSTAQAKNAMRHSVAITSVDVPAPTTQAGAPIDTASHVRYAFAYKLDPVTRAHPDLTTQNGPVLMLERIDYPTYSLASGGTGSPYSMYYGYNPYGEISCRTLPVETTAGYSCGQTATLKADFLYWWGNYFYTGRFLSNGSQARHTKGVSPGNPAAVDVTGVSRHVVMKRVQLQAGTDSGTWTYDRPWGAFTNPTRVRVTDPFGNDTVHYFNGSLQAPYGQTGAGPEDGYAPEWDDGTNYRIDYFEGLEANGRVIRSETQEFDGDLIQVQTTLELKRSKNNVRSRRSTTIYIDAGRKEHVVSRSGWDGLGHWQKQVEIGFDVPAARTTFTTYLNWTGDTISRVYDTGRVLLSEVSDGSRVLSRMDNVYFENEPVHGLLDYSLMRKTPPAQSGTGPDPSARAGDVKTKYSYSTYSGNVIKKELWSDATVAGPSYSIRYGWVPVGLAGTTCTVPGECGGYLATKAFENAGAVPWLAIDRTRDGNTGLIVATRDTAGLQTSYTYDSLGRVMTIAPPGEETTKVDYLSLQTTHLTQGDTSSTNYIKALYSYDTLGRLVTTEKRPADPAPGNNSCQRSQYDLANRVTYQTEWKYVPANGCTPLPVAQGCWPGLTAQQLTDFPGTQFDFRNPDSGLCDAFGRTHKVTPADSVADDKMTRTDYSGLDSTVTVNGIKGPGGTTFTSTTRYFRDAFNRLVAVDAPEGADALYTYDAQDRLETVELTDNQPVLPKQQFRQFAYDGLGRMLWVENPESGTTVYLGYDALGNPLKIQDAKGNVQRFYYDFAGRPQSKSVSPAGSIAEIYVADFWYDESNRGDSAGKLTSIRSRDDAGTNLLLESRTYGGLGGRLSLVKHDFSSYWDAASAVTTTYGYTTRGELASITYPQESPTTRTILTVTYANTNGFVTKVTETESNVTMDPRDLATFTYNASGAMESMTALGGVGGKTTFTFDVRNRPQSITGGLFDSGTGQWTYQSGNYAYDGAGNIHQIGNNSYGYDGVNRLVSAHTAYSSSLFDETFAYDIFGNMAVKTFQMSGGSVSNEADVFALEAPQTPLTNRILNLATEVNGTPQGMVPYFYDANGNVVQGGRRGAGGVDVKRYQYGPMNRLQRIQQVVSPDTDPIKTAEVDRFAYDTSGNRIWRIEKGTGLQVYSVRDASGQVLSEFRAPSPSFANFVEWAADYIYAGGRLVSMKQNLNPRQPVNLKATQAPSGSGWQVTLTWDPNPETNVTYKIERFREGIDPVFQTLSTQVASPTYLDMEVLPTNLGVRYRVSCVDVATASTSQPSAQVRIRTGDTGAPTVPSLLGVSGDGSATLTWTFSSDSSDIAGYELNRRLSLADPRVPVTPGLIQGNSYVDLNVVNGTTYYYSVRAKDMAGNWSGYSCAPIPPGVCDRTVTPKDKTPPSPPKRVTASPICGAGGGVEKINVSWEVPADCPGCATYYDVYRNTQPVFTSLMPVATGLTLTSGLTMNGEGRLVFDDPFTPTPGVVYYYAVRAWDGPNLLFNQSAFSEIASTFTRDASITPQFRPWSRSFDRKVVLRWPTIPDDPSSQYRVYRRLNVSGNCGDYVQVGSGGITSAISPPAWEYTDDTMDNNAAYDYAVTSVVGGVESSFSRPILGIPLARTTNLFQCQAHYPDAWNQNNVIDQANVVQWTPPNVTPYQPYSANSDSLGFLAGYHVYHHKLCGKPDQFGLFQDNSPTREVVFNSSDPNDPYLLRKTLVQGTDNFWEYQDPRFPVVTGTPTQLSPMWKPPQAPAPLPYDQYIYGGANGCIVSSNNHGTNCIMPKAVYKMFAEGIWLPVESDWPSFFDPYNEDPDARCQSRIINPYSPGGTIDPEPPPYCDNGLTNPSFIPPPTKFTALASGTIIDLSWSPPRIGAGKSGLAGYYLYAAKASSGIFNTHSVRPPLPVATLGPSETTHTLSGLEAGPYDLRIASFDDAGHVSMDGSYRCNETGAYGCDLPPNCSTLCSVTRAACDATHPCPNTGTCSIENTVFCTQNQNCASQVCSNNPADHCVMPPPPAPTAILSQVASTTSTDYTNGNLVPALPAIPALGNTLIAVVAQVGGGNGVDAITQSGVQWNSAGSSSGGSIKVNIWYGYVNQSNANPVTTITLKKSTQASAIVQEYSGIKIPSLTPVDRTAFNTGTSNSPSTGTTSNTNQPNELWVGAMSIKNASASFNPASGWREVMESPGGSGDGAEKLVFEEKIVSMTGQAGVGTTTTLSTAWTGVVVAFRGLDPIACPGGACVSQTCNLTSNNQCNAIDLCQKTIGRWCQSNAAIGCDVAEDCPRWGPAPGGDAHCSGTTTSCNPASPTTGCAAGQVCVAGDKCLNGSQASAKATVTLGSGSTPPALNPDFAYDATVLPPPQNFRAWAPQDGSFDMHDIHLKWCPEPTSTTQRVMPAVTEYVVYRSKTRGGPHKILAHLSPACLEPDKRCEIMGASDVRVPPGSTAVACINNDGTDNPGCTLIEPLAGSCGGAGQRPCAIVDMTFEAPLGRCWPHYAMGPVQYFNYVYVVTAKGQLDQGPITESMPSVENEGWINYCSPIPGTGCCTGSCDMTQPGCCDNFKTCTERRDPDGTGDFPACTDGHVELMLDQAVAPFRSIGAKPGVGIMTVTYSPPSTFVFYHPDHLGSPRVIVDELGAVKATHHYLPFGDEKPSQTDLTPNTRAFTGHERDEESGLDYMLARYYSSSLGRFMAVDPAADSIAPEDPQTWNRYAYALNNPLKFLDSDGQKTELAIGQYTSSNPAGGASMNPVGHASLIINGTAYSYGTTYSGKLDWGVSAEAFFAPQDNVRQTTLYELNISPEQEAALQSYLDSHNPNEGSYSVNGHSCVSVTEQALESTGILNDDRDSVTATPHGDVQGGTPPSLTPRGLAGQATGQAGLVRGATTRGSSPMSSGVRPAGPTSVDRKIAAYRNRAAQGPVKPVNKK